jgi:hypothetical protein
MSERKRMPDERPSITKKLHIRCANEEEQLQWTVDRLRDKLQEIRGLAQHGSTMISPDQVLKVLNKPEQPPAEIEDIKVYIQVGLYPDTNQPGEIFMKSDRMGSTISGLLDALSMSISIALQSGVPLTWFIEKLKNMQFVPAGPTSDPKIKYATSIVDGLAKWLEYRFPPPSEGTVP